MVGLVRWETMVWGLEGFCHGCGSKRVIEICPERLVRIESVWCASALGLV